jgi:methyl-accepting chemotaxis protein
MSNKDLTTEILIQIRDEMKGMREELKGTREELSARIDQTNTRLDQTNVRLERTEKRQAASEIRLATEIVNVVQAVNQLKDLLVADRDLRHKVEEHDRRIAVLEQHAP